MDTVLLCALLMLLGCDMSFDEPDYPRISSPASYQVLSPSILCHLRATQGTRTSAFPSTLQIP
jgi:hypothetical protein